MIFADRNYVLADGLTLAARTRVIEADCGGQLLPVDGVEVAVIDAVRQRNAMKHA